MTAPETTNGPFVTFFGDERAVRSGVGQRFWTEITCATSRQGSRRT